LGVITIIDIERTPTIYVFTMSSRFLHDEVKVNWGGRAIHRSDPLPISPSLYKNLGSSPRRIIPGTQGYYNQEEAGDEKVVGSEDELELDFLDWKLELEGDGGRGGESSDSSRDRPGNPLARQLELNLSLRPYDPSPRSKDFRLSKRSRQDLMMSVSSEQQLFNMNGSPERSGEQFRSSSPLSPMLGHFGTQSYYQSQHSCSSSSTMITPPASPAGLPQQQQAATTKYYTGGPLMHVDTPRTPQRLTREPSFASSSTPVVPQAWRGNSPGSTPPSIFYSKDSAAAARGGGVSPLREVIRNLGLS